MASNNTQAVRPIGIGGQRFIAALNIALLGAATLRGIGHVPAPVES
jgi:hypothetical protein